MARQFQHRGHAREFLSGCKWFHRFHPYGAPRPDHKLLPTPGRGNHLLPGRLAPWLGGSLSPINGSMDQLLIEKLLGYRVGQRGPRRPSRVLAISMGYRTIKAVAV